MKHSIKDIINKTVFIIVAISFFAMVFLPFQLFAEKLYPDYLSKINSKAMVLVDVNSTVTLYKKNETMKMDPGYLTKIMTGILVLENCPDLTKEFTFTYSAVMKNNNQNVEKLGSTPGDKLTIKDGLYSMFCTSANDVANALAEHVAGNIHDFVIMMNEKANSLGMNDTNFANPTGLYDEGQYSTCNDLAILTTYALHNPLFSDMATVTTYTHAPIKRFSDPNNVNNTLIQKNQILRKSSKYYHSNITSAVFGGNKTQGYNFSTSKEENNLHLLLINLGAENQKQGYEDITNIFKSAYENFLAYKISEYDSSFPSDLGALKLGNIYLTLPESLTISKESTITLPYEIAFKDLHKNILFGKKLYFNPSSLGVIEYLYKDTLVGKASIIPLSTKELKDVDITTRTSSGLIYASTTQEEKSFVESSNTKSPIYRDENGKLRISPSILKVGLILLLISLIIVLFIVIRAKVISHIRKKRMDEAKKQYYESAKQNYFNHQDQSKK